MPNEKRPLQVFLCHAHDDKAKTRELHRHLRKRGVQPWLDAENLIAGENWREEIPKALRKSDAIIVCLSRNSINKEGYVQAEIRFALEKFKEIPPGRIFLIPVRFEECEVPDTLESFHYVDLFEEEGLSKLMKALKMRAHQLDIQEPPRDEPAPDIFSTTEADEKKKQQLKNLENQAIQFESKGDLENARRTWCEIQQIAPLFPQVDKRIEDLERAIAEEAARERAERESAERVEREKAARAAAEKARRERAERFAARLAALKKIFSNAKLFLGIGIVGIVLVLSWLVGQILPHIFLPSQITDAKGAQMVLVPAGEFTMGNDKGLSNEGPAHPVYLDAFYIDKYEVTNALYRACATADACLTPVNAGSYNDLARQDHPVVNVDWNMAKAYCQWRGARLPTEAEWEKAARGTEKLVFPWGESLEIKYANFNSNGTKAVGSYPDAKSPYGVLDMAGNVSEWVFDWYSLDYYRFVLKNKVPNPQGPSVPPFGSSHNYYGRVLRGGSWNTTGGSYLSTTYRFRGNPSLYSSEWGFRCAKTANP